MDYVTKVLLVQSSMRKGHAVLVPPLDTDYSLSAMVVAALLGAFYASPRDFCNEANPHGVQYAEKYRNTKQMFHVAVSAVAADLWPTLPLLLNAIAQAPGSSFKYYYHARKLCQFFKKRVKAIPSLKQRSFVLSLQTDRNSAHKKYKEIILRPRDFLLKFDASVSAVLTGCRPVQ